MQHCYMNTIIHVFYGNKNRTKHNICAASRNTAGGQEPTALKDEPRTHTYTHGISGGILLRRIIWDKEPKPCY